MRTRHLCWAAGLALGVSLGAGQAAGQSVSAPVVTPHVRAQLVALDRADDGRVALGLRLTLKPGWHTYWRNPGDSGEPPTLKLSAPDGASARLDAWPSPEVIDIGGIVSYGHHGDVLFLGDATVPKGTTQIDAEATWLVCDKVCVPEAGKFRVDLASAGGIDSTTAGALDRLKPILSPSLEAVVTRAGDKLRLTVPVGKIGGTPAKAYFFPYQSDVVDHSAKQSFRVDDGTLALDMTPFDVRAKAPLELSGLLEVETVAADGSKQTRRYEVLARIGG